MVDRHIPTRLLSGALGVLLIAQPVAAQTGLGLFREGICGPRIAPLLVAGYFFLVTFTALFAVFHLGNGLRKMGGGPQQQQEGRQEAFNSRFAFVATLVFMSTERILAFLGLSPVDCINFTLP